MVASEVAPAGEHLQPNRNAHLHLDRSGRRFDTEIVYMVHELAFHQKGVTTHLCRASAVLCRERTAAGVFPMFTPSVAGSLSLHQG